MEISYSCMNNMTKTINSRNKCVPSKNDQVNLNLRNFQNHDNLPA